MKHFKQLLILALLAIIGTGQMWADYSYTFESKQFNANESAVAHTLGSVSWNHTCSQVVASGKSAYWGYDATKGQQWGSGNAQASVTLSTSGISGTITQVSINASIGNSGGASLSVTVGGNTFKYNNNNSVSPTTTATTYNFTGTGSGTIIITYNSTIKKAIYMKSIAVTASSGGGSGKQDLTDAQFKWSSTSATVTKGAANNTFPTLTNSKSVSVTYTSSNENVATINSSGVVTLVKGGTTTITAAVINNATYNDKSVSYTLTVNKPSIAGGIVDVLTHSTFTATTGYTAFTNKQGNGNDHSPAIYAGKTNRNGNSTQYNIQLNTINSSGNPSASQIATTKSGGLARRVEVTWATQTNNTADRKLTVYGNSEAYSGTATSTSGTKIGDITYVANATEDYLDIEDDYKYIQIVASGAIYMDEIDITWVAPPTYTINKVPTGCTLTVQKGGSDVTSAAEGDEITVSATADTGYNTPNITVKDAQNNNITVTNGKFTMPAKAVTVTATASMTDYTVTVNQSPDVSATTSGQTTTAHYNGTINLTTTVPSGYAFVNWTTTDGFSITNATSATTASFTMPAKNVAVTANFRKLVQSITVKNGDANVAGQTIEMTVGDVINLSVVFDPSDATNKTLTWTSGDDTKATLSNGTLTAVAATTSNVTMTVSTPDLVDPVTFYVKVNEPVGNTVTLTQPTLGGTVDASPKGEVDEGDEVTLSYEALSTHEFVAWIVKDEDEDDVEVTNNKFTMPDKSVTVTASFRPKAPIFTLAAGSYEGNQVVKLSSFDGDHFLYYYTLDGNDPDENSTSYDDNTTGIVLSTSKTLKMIIYDEELQASAITTAVYTITHTPSVLTLSANGNTYTFDQNNTHYLNEVVQLPTDIPNNYKIAGKVFKGWSSVAITTPSTAEPTSNFYQPGGDYTLSTTAPTLYAVYATEVAGATTWTRVTAINTLTGGGTFIMGYEASAKSGEIVPLRSADCGATTSANGILNTGTTANSSTSGTINMSTVTSTSDYEVYISSPATGKINIQMSTSSGNYYGATNGGTTSNKARLYTSGNSNETNLTPEWASEANNQFKLTAGVSGSYKYLKYNVSDPRFAFYNSAGEKIVFYKKGSGPATYKDYVTSVATYAITEATCENGEVVADKSTATAGATITITAAGGAAYDLLSFDVYKTGESSTKVAVTVDENDYTLATFTMPAYAVTVSATFIKVGSSTDPLTVAELQENKANLKDYYVYAQGIVSQLGAYNSYNGYYTYYFSGDGTNTNQFQVYNGWKGSHQVGEDWYYDSFDNASDLAVGDEVIVEGTIDIHNTTYQFKDQESELTSHCRPVVVTKGAETSSEGTYTLTSGGNALSAKYCLSDLSGENDLTVTVTASPQPGYRLKAITSKDANNQTVGTIGTINANVCTITGIKASTTITATFEQIYSVALAVSAAGTTGNCSATINGGAGPVVVTTGETINLVASLTDTENDEFVNFTATDGITITTTGDLTATATVTQDGTITANFRALPDPHTITNAGVSATYGTITMKDMSDNVQSSMSMRPDKTGKLVATESEGYRFLSWTVSPANAVTFADATSLETTFTAKDVEASISATYEARTAYTVKFMNGNTQIGTDATVYDGRTIDLLGAQTSFDANHTRFCGWVKNSFEGLANVEPSFVSGAQTIDDNTTFYAVYGNAVETNNYKKITTAGELEDGDYVIAAPYSTSIYAMQGVGTTNNNYQLKGTAVTPVEDVISDPEANLIWTLDVTNSGVSFYTAQQTNHYLYTYKSGSYKDLGFQASARMFTCEVSNGTWSIQDAEDDNSYYLAWANSNTRFEAVGSASDMYLYKQVFAADEWVSLPVEYVSVTFDKHAGSETVTNMPANITGQMEGYSLTEPSETPERAGYNFIGWNTDDEATEPMFFPQTINTNTTVYAIWQSYPDCAIDLYVNGVKNDDISTAVKQGAELDLSAIDAPDRLGYEFLGWAANPRPEENTTAIDIVEAYTPTPNEDTQKSFYAVYTRQEGQAQYEKASSISAGKYLIVCEDQNVAFDGSLNALDGAGRVVAVSISDDVIAYSETIDASTFTIAAVTGGYSIQSASGRYIGREDNTNGLDESTLTPATNTITITSGDADIVGSGGAHLRCNPNSGNQWFRYFKSSSYTSQKAIQLYKYIAGTTYYTTNPAVNYNVSYNLAGGAWKEDEGCESAIVAANDSYDVCEDVPFKTDNIFTGWTVGGEAIGASITVTETTEIVANYRAAETYSVTYDANGALGTAPAAASVKEGANYTVLANSWFFKAGYSFTGWNTAADGNGTAYAKDAVITMPSENLTLYAQWSNSISERDVVIVAHYGDKYYAMGQTLSSGQLNAVQVQMFNGKVRDVAEENRAAITWHMIVNSSNNTVSFYSPANEKYLGAGSSTNLALSEDAVEWIWDSENKCYKVSEGTRTFWYRNTESGKDADYYNYFKYFSISGSVGKDYFASEMILAYGFAVTIDGNATESALTIGDDVVVTEDAELTINSERVLNSLTVEAGGSLKLNDGAAKKLIVNDLTINTQSGASGQVSGTNVQVSGDIYLEIKLCEGAMKEEASRKWYCISAPFNVNMNGGFFWGDGTPMVLNTDFQLFEWDGDRRAGGISGWKRVSGTMNKNTAYLIGFDDKNTKNQNTIKLKATTKTINSQNTIEATEHSGSAGSDYANWNGLANPNFHYVGLDQTVQVFDASLQGYDVYPFVETGTTYGFVVGTAFFYKGEATINLNTNDHGSNLRAPKRVSEKYNYCVEIAKEGASRYDNRLFVQASEDAESTYKEGIDLITLNGTTSNYGALLWTENYGGKRLAIEEAPLVNGTASYVLTLSAPQAGTYSISVAAPKENADLYLTYEGSIIWNLSMSEYTLDLNKGITNGYGLILRANAPSAATGIDEAESGKQKAESVQKIILDEKVFILRGGKMYDVTGKAVK